MTKAPRFERRKPYDHTGSQRTPTRSIFLLLSQCDGESGEAIRVWTVPPHTRQTEQKITQREELAPRKGDSSSGVTQTSHKTGGTLSHTIERRSGPPRRLSQTVSSNKRSDQARV